MTPGWGGRPLRAFLSTRCGLMRRKGAAAPHAVCANHGDLLFFIVIFYRCLCETMEVNRASTRPQVAGARLKGCGSGRSRWHRGAACALGQGRPKVADRRSHCFRIVIYNDRPEAITSNRFQTLLGAKSVRFLIDFLAILYHFYYTSNRIRTV